jgi:hypothetical protein
LIDGNVFALKLHKLFNYLSFFIMSRDLLIGALRRGQTGNEILAILDALTGSDSTQPTEDVSVEPTLELIEF